MTTSLMSNVQSKIPIRFLGGFESPILTRYQVHGTRYLVPDFVLATTHVRLASTTTHQEEVISTVIGHHEPSRNWCVAVVRPVEFRYKSELR
jgi:hypothetical protein